MSCERWKEVDLADYVAVPDAAAMAGFHAHVAGCADCGREVEIWRDMLGRLAAGPPQQHPSPEALLRWVDAPSELPEEQARRVAAHLARCRPCADEVAALRSFDFTRLASGATTASRDGRRAADGMSRRPRAAGAAPRRVRPSYALLAAGVAALLLGAWLVAERGREAGAPPGTEIALRDVPRAAVPPAPPPAAAPERGAEPEPERAMEPELAKEPAPELAKKREPALEPAREQEPARDREPAPAAPPPAHGAAAGAPDAPASAPAPAPRRAPEPEPESALARAVPPREPAAPGPTDAESADALLDRFLGAPRTGDGTRPAAPAAPVDSSALAFGSSAASGGRAGDDARVAVLDEARRAVGDAGGALRLRVRAPLGSAGDAAVRVRLTAPDGTTWTIDAAPRPGSPWHEVLLAAERLHEPGRYAVRVSAHDERGASDSYEGVLELR